MLDIIILVALCAAIGNRCKKKNIKAGLYQFLIVVFWIGGAFGGAAIGGAFANGEIGIVLISTFVGAGTGAAIVFGIVAAQRKGPAPIYGGGARKGIVIGPPGSGQPVIQPRSDVDAQAAAQQAQACEAGQRWGEAVKLWQTVTQTSTDPRMIEYARQRVVQIEQWLAQHFQAGR